MPALPLLRLPLSFFSAVYCFLVVRKIKLLHISRQDLQRRPGLDQKLLKLGTPVVFQNTIIAIGGLVVQYVVNGYGFLFVAGFTATNKLYGILEMAAISYGYAIVTYVGQNLGAGEIDRIKKGVRSSTLLAFLTSADLLRYVYFWKTAFVHVYFRRAFPGRTGIGYCLEISFYHGMLSLYPVFPSCIQISPPGSGKHLYPHAQRCC